LNGFEKSENIDSMLETVDEAVDGRTTAEVVVFILFEPRDRGGRDGAGEECFFEGEGGSEGGTREVWDEEARLRFEVKFESA
jgi:hypothetical protein